MEHEMSLQQLFEYLVQKEKEIDELIYSFKGNSNEILSRYQHDPDVESRCSSMLVWLIQLKLKSRLAKDLCSKFRDVKMMVNDVCGGSGSVV